MRIALLLSLWLVAPVSPAVASTPQRATRPPSEPARPAAAQSRGAQPAAGRSGIAMLVTDPAGATLADVEVDVTGPSERNGRTNTSGQVNFAGMQAGTYRLRFSGPQVTTFEREVSLRAGQTATIDVTLNPAPPPREIIKEAPPPPAAAPPVGPAGAPQTISLVDLLDKELDRKQPRRETLVACSGNTRSTLLQLNQDQPERLYEQAESTLYVIAGEGSLRIAGRDTRLMAGAFASVPRNTSFALAHRGRNPLILLSVLSGEPCEQAK
jgi:mannose-6-phosphate isomerase-like protein (cupin superfamily)